MDDYKRLEKEYWKAISENIDLKDKVQTLKGSLLITGILIAMLIAYPFVSGGGDTRDIETDCDARGCQSY